MALETTASLVVNFDVLSGTVSIENHNVPNNLVAEYMLATALYGMTMRDSERLGEEGAVAADGLLSDTQIRFDLAGILQASCHRALDEFKAALASKSVVLGLDGQPLAGKPN